MVAVDREFSKIYEELESLAFRVSDSIRKASIGLSETEDPAIEIAEKIDSICKSSPQKGIAYVYLLRIPEKDSGFVPAHMWDRASALVDVLSSYVECYCFGSSEIVSTIERSGTPHRQDIVALHSRLRSLFSLDFMRHETRKDVSREEERVEKPKVDYRVFLVMSVLVAILWAIVAAIDKSL